MTEASTETFPHVKIDIHGPQPAMSHWHAIDALREQHRFFWADEGQGYWVLTRYEDIREAFQTPEVFCNHSIVATDPDPAYRFLPSFTDPPIHIAYRRPMNPWFSPGSVAKLEPRLRELARAEVERARPDGRCDYVAAFGDRFPVAGFLASMGLPQDDADFFVSLVHRMDTRKDADAVKGMTAAWGELGAYWADMLADRRKHPLDPDVDFVTMMSRAKLDDDPMPDEDIVDIMVTLTIGSLDLPGRGSR
jgi:cytochrome P450